MRKPVPFPYFPAKWVVSFVLILIVVAGVGAAAYWYFFRVLPVESTMAKAEHHISVREWGAGVRAAKRVLQLDPDHLEANMLAGDILLQFRHPATRHFYSIAYRQAPERWDVWKRLVDYHILMSDRYDAKQMIDNPPPGSETHEIWWEAYFHFSLKSGAIAEARKAAQTLIEMKTAKELSWDFVLAQLNAQQPDDMGLRKSGQQRLLEFYHDSPTWRHSAARVYVECLITEGEQDKMLRFIQGWLKLEDIPLGDILFCLNMAGEIDDEVKLKGIQLLQSRARSGAQVAEVMEWMMGKGYDKVIWMWMPSLNNELLSTPEVLSILSVYCARKEDWVTLQGTLLANEDRWQGNRSLYLLYQAYIDHKTRDIINVSMLRQAAREAGGERDGFRKLKQGCIRLDWRRGWQEVLPFLVYEPEVSFAAAMELYRDAVEAGRYEEMLKIAARAYSVNQEDYAVSNNYAYLLLVYGGRLEDAHKIALKNYVKFPFRTNSIVTYVLSLWRQEEDQKAFDVLSSLEEELRNTPSIVFASALMEATRDPEAAAEIRGRLKEDQFAPMEWKLLHMDPQERAEQEEAELQLDDNESLKVMLQESGFEQGWAARTLIEALLQEDKEADAYDLIDEWVKKRDLSFEDAFFALTTIRSGERDDLVEQLSTFCRRRADTADEVARLLRWEIRAGRAESALGWLSGMPPSRRDSPEVLNVVADYRIAQKQWERLKQAVPGGGERHWSGHLVDYYLIRAASLSEAGASEMDQQETIEKLFQQAVQETRGDVVVLKQIEARILAWGWPDGWSRFNRIYLAAQASEKQRMQLTRAREGGRPVLEQELSRARQVLAETPDSSEAKARVAYYQLVGGEQVLASREMALTAYAADPASVMSIAAYLLALVQQGEFDTAGDAVERIPVQWKYHPTLLLAQVLVLNEVQSETADRIRRGLDEKKYTEEEWALLP